jgi:chemotaxis protein CheD
VSDEPDVSVSGSTARDREGDRSRRVVGVSNYAVATDDEVLVAYGLGTCVAVGLSDPANGVSALAHTVLPREPADSTAPPGKYADTTVQAMLRDMVDEGAGYGSVTAWLVGGATVFPVADLGLPENIGTETAAAAREQLSGLDAPVVAEAVGGDHGRTVEFDTGTGDVLCHRADGEPRSLDMSGRNWRDN